MSRSLIGILSEPLLIEARGIPQLLESIRTELTAGWHDGGVPEALPEFFSESGREQIDDTGSVPEGSLVAVVPLVNVVTRHGYWAAAGTLQTGRLLRTLDSDPAVGSIVLSVNSPGGSVYGTAELADILRGIRERGQTRTVAVADPLMASAATWIGTAAKKVYAIGSGDVGSIGVINSYVDYSKMYESLGISVDVMRTPELKARFTGVEPLTDAMRATMEQRLEEAYRSFVGAMAANRQVTEQHVEEHFGKGELMRPADAITAGLIDGIADLDGIVGQLLAEAKDYRSKRRQQRANQRRLDLEKIR